MHGNDEDDLIDEGYPWEQRAASEVRRLLRSADLDGLTGTVRLPPHSTDGFNRGAECSNFDQLTGHLREVYGEIWYAYVPFDSGQAVFEDDAWGYVEDLLTDNPHFADFFASHAKPEGTEELILAGELLLDLNAAKVLRLSVEDINAELIQYLALHPEKMRELSPRKFEELVASMFRNQGYDVTLTPRTGDGGLDVIAIQKSGLGTVMIVVECKRYSPSNKVGVGVVRGLYGVVEERRATRGIIATTSTFTRGAVEFTDRLAYRLALADFEVLSQSLRDWKSQASEAKLDQ